MSRECEHPRRTEVLGHPATDGHGHELAPGPFLGWMCADCMVPVSDPIDRIEWRDARELTGNAWNPNLVHPPEMLLIAESILRQGWIQPLLINPTGVIIDGFHRWTISQEHAELIERYQYRVPCAVLNVGDAEAKLLTVRINRAKGTHVAVRMADLVREVIESGMDKAEVVQQLGATEKEVDLLLSESVFKAFDTEHWEYSPAWTTEEKSIEIVEGDWEAGPCDYATIERLKASGTPQRGTVSLEQTQGTSWYAVIGHDGTVRAVAAILETSKVMRLKGLYTHPDYRRRGYAAELVRARLYAIRGSGKAVEALTRRPDSYIAQGFTKVSERNGIFKLRRAGDYPD